jgi:hypothetical protein
MCCAVNSRQILSDPGGSARRPPQAEIAFKQHSNLDEPEGSIRMSRNTLYLVIGLLAAGVIVVGYLYYEESRSPSGIEIEIGEHGITIEEK